MELYDHPLSIALFEHARKPQVAQPHGYSFGHGEEVKLLGEPGCVSGIRQPDALLYNEAAHVNIINVSCPQQLLGIMKWIMEGNEGIAYVWVLRSPAPVIYDAGFRFEFGKAYTVKSAEEAQATIVSTGRGVHEAIEAAGILRSKNIPVDVVAGHRHR